jgi:hypothetical protein
MRQNTDNTYGFVKTQQEFIELQVHSYLDCAKTISNLRLLLRTFQEDDGVDVRDGIGNLDSKV